MLPEDVECFFSSARNELKRTEAVGNDKDISQINIYSIKCHRKMFGNRCTFNVPFILHVFSTFNDKIEPGVVRITNH